MASKEDVLQLKKSVQELRKGQLEILMKLENIQERIDQIDSSGGSNEPSQLEPILTCVHCLADYKESLNAEGSCKYHNGILKFARSYEFKYTCCGKTTADYNAGKTIEGCTKGKHRSKHHTDFVYSHYRFYMQDTSNSSKELWMTMDIEDFVTEYCLWSEVGITVDDSLFILVGTSRIDYHSIVTFNVEELRLLTDTKVVMNINDDVGWSIKAIVMERLIQIELKPASNKEALIKQVGYYINDDNQLKCDGRINYINNPYKNSVLPDIRIGEDSYEGPVIDIGEDYSKDRKNDYEAQVSGNCPLQLVQVGSTEVSSTMESYQGVWKNMFSCKTKVTNSGKENISVTNVTGYYKSNNEWISVDEVQVGREIHRNNYEWFDTSNFWLNAGTTGTLNIRLAIDIEGSSPGSYHDGKRAHSSLPQPLYLKFIFTDHNHDTISLQFEQGNSPLDIATKGTRTAQWTRKDPSDLLFWSFADDVSTNKRSDVAIYRDETGIMVYRPAPLGNGGQYYPIEHSLYKFGYKGKGQHEVELTQWKKESKGSSIIPYAVVDVNTAITYAIKVVIETPTSKAINYFQCPPNEYLLDSNVLTVKDSTVSIKGEVTIQWKLARTSVRDKFLIYPLYGRSPVSSTLYNSKKLLEGEAKMKAPDKPGQYEVRYYPGSLTGQHTGFKHDVYIAPVQFTVARED